MLFIRLYGIGCQAFAVVGASCLRYSIKKVVPNIFAEFEEKHPCRGLFLIKLQAYQQL